MKLEFLAGGSPDCPLIRIYKFNSKEAYGLRRMALQLARGDGCELTLQQGQKDFGVSEISPMKFEWVLSQAGWLQVADLIRPFSMGHHRRLAMAL